MYLDDCIPRLLASYYRTLRWLKSMWVPLRVAVVSTKIHPCSETKTGDISVMSFFSRPPLYKYTLFARIERPMLVSLLPLR
jgi:hypothetical protein